MKPSRNLCRTSLLVASCCAAGLLVPACKSADDTASPATRPASVSSQPASVAAPTSAVSRPAGPPVTMPAVPDPREAKLLANVTQLTSGFDRAGEGYFSNDMKAIIFQATPKGEKEYQMYVAPLEIGDGSAPKIGNPVRISPPNSRNTCGYFSPDGKTIIFGSTAGKEKPEEPSAGYQRQGRDYRWSFPDGMEIFAAENWGGIHRGVVAIRPTGMVREKAEFEDLAIAKNRLTNNDSYDAEGSFSPDGKHICFTSRRSGDTEVWVMKADGSNAVQITNHKNYDGGPFFSPDGKKLIYRSDRKGNDLLQVYTTELTFDEAGNVTGGRNETQLTDDANVNWGPIYAPDGSHIAYATSAHGHHNYEIYAMKPDGSAKTRVTWCAGFDALPAISPDGKYLMWSSKRTKDNTTQLFIAKYTPPAEVSK